MTGQLIFIGMTNNRKNSGMLTMFGNQMKNMRKQKKYLYTCLKIIFYSPFAKISLQFRLLKYLFQNTFYQMLIQVSEIQRIILSIKL